MEMKQHQFILIIQHLTKSKCLRFTLKTITTTDGFGGGYGKGKTSPPLTNRCGLPCDLKNQAGK